MPQTLLALCGVVVATFLTLQSQRHRVLTASDVSEVEVTQMGARVAMDALGALRALPFDAATVDAPATSPAALRHHLKLKGDLRDRFKTLHGRRAAAQAQLPPSAIVTTLNYADGHTTLAERTTEQGPIQFRIETVVGYVEADGATPSPTPTKLKVASVRVTPLVAAGLDVPPILLSQLYACGRGCDW